MTRTSHAGSQHPDQLMYCRLDHTDGLRRYFLSRNERAGMRNRAIVISDTQGTIQMWSEGATHLFGFAEEEAIGRKLDIVVPAHLRDDHWRGFHGAMASGVVHGEGQFSDIPGLQKNGDIRTFRVQLQLLRDEKKIPIGAMAIFVGQ